MIENIYLAVMGIAVGVLLALYVRELVMLSKPLDTPRPDWLPYVDPDEDDDATGGWRGTGTINYTGTLPYTGTYESDPFDELYAEALSTGSFGHRDPDDEFDCTGGSWTDNCDDSFYDHEPDHPYDEEPEDDDV